MLRFCVTHPRGVLALVIILTVTAFFVPYWVTGRVFGTFDLAHITIPLEQLFARYQAGGDLPVWVGEFNAGFPLMANGFQSFYYLPHLMLRPLLPAVWLVNLSLWAHLLLAAGGMWLLLRSQRVAAAGAAVGALCFAAAGYFIGRLTLPHLLFPAAWLPLLFWSISTAWQQRTAQRVVLAAVVAALLVLSGHIQMIWYAVLAAVLLGLTLLFFPAEQKGGRVVRLTGAAVLAALLVAVHILPLLEHLPLSRRGAVQTDIEAYDVSYPVWQALTWINPRLYGLGADYRGPKNEPEMMVYFGVLGTMAGAAGLCSKRLWRTPLGVTAVALLVVGTALALGGSSPLYRWLHEQPTPLAGLANPGRAIVLVHLGWSIAAGYGAAQLLTGTTRQRARQVALALAVLGVVGVVLYWGTHAAVAPRLVPNAVPFILVLAGGIALAGATVLLVVPQRQRSPIFLVLLAGELVYLGYQSLQPVPVETLTRPLVLAESVPARADAPRIFSTTILEPAAVGDFGITPGVRVSTVSAVEQTLTAAHPNLHGLLVDMTWDRTLASSGTVQLALHDEHGVAIRTATLPGLAIRPDEPLRFSFAPVPDSAAQRYRVRLESSYENRLAPVMYLRANPGGAQFNPSGEGYQCNRLTCTALVNTDWQTDVDASIQPMYAPPGPQYLSRELLVPMFGEGEGYRMVRAHLSLQWQRLDDYLRTIGERGDFDSQAFATHRDMVDRLAVGTIVAAFAPYRELTGLAETTLVARAPAGERELHVYRNERAYPRVHLAERALPLSAEAARHHIHAATLPAGTVTVEDLALPSDFAPDPTASATVREDTGELVRIEVQSSATELLVMRDVLLPGWTATVDGALSPIGTVDTLFRGVMVPPGTHEVVFRYHSSAVAVGSAISALTASGVVLGAGVTLWRRRRV